MEGARAPNLGPIWAQRPRLDITERLLDRWRLLHTRSLQTHIQIPADLEVKGSRVQISPARLEPSIPFDLVGPVFNRHSCHRR